MEQKIKIEHEGKEYILMYTLATIRNMDSAGYTPTTISDPSVSSTLALITGAFQARHAGLSEKQILSIYADIPNKESFLEALGGMYVNMVNSILTDTEAEDSAKNATWTVM